MALWDKPVVNRLSDNRLQLRHGPIELIIEAFGSQTEVDAAYQQAVNSFATVLEDLAGELNELRKQTNANAHLFKGDIAKQMVKVAESFAHRHFITPMIAVAGAVADHILHHMVMDRNLSRAYVNNGGDIALFLNDKESFNVGVCANPHTGAIVSQAKITEDSDVRGIATSGWRGRSHSLGIADSVTVLARNSAIADAAATLIANAIDLPNHPMIKRATATELSPDSDLGNRLVTVDVGTLSPAESKTALNLGQKLAQSLIESKQIISVYGSLNDEVFSLYPSLQPTALYNAPSQSNFDNVQKEQASA